jgi:type III pantothenate kinase
MLMLYQTYKIEPEEISKVIIGSVVPQLTKVMSAAIKKIHDIHPVIVDRNTPSGVQAKSKQMGTDIYANLVAAHNMYPTGKKLFWISERTYSELCCESGETLG